MDQGERTYVLEAEILITLGQLLRVFVNQVLRLILLLAYVSAHDKILYTF